MSKRKATETLIRKHHVVLYWPKNSDGKRIPMWRDYFNRPATIADIPNHDGYNVAVVPKDHAVLDLDRKNGVDGVATLDVLAKANGTSYDQLATSTLRVISPSGGVHLWFKYGGDLTTVNAGGGLEIKRKTSTIHVPPSDGYTWVVRPVAELPPWLEDFWRDARSTVWDSVGDSSFANGRRHDSLKAFALKARETLCLGVDELEALLHATNEARCDPPLDADEVSSLAQWAATKQPTAADVRALMQDALSAALLR